LISREFPTEEGKPYNVLLDQLVRGLTPLFDYDWPHSRAKQSRGQGNIMSDERIEEKRAFT
jgi:hypothetical protein